MLWEWINYALTPAPREVRRWGLVYESVALEARGRRQRGAWRPHLEACHHWTRQFVTEHQVERLIVLGSGPLFDVSPWIFTGQQVKRVTLVDIVHPRSVLRARRQWPLEHELVRFDLTEDWTMEDFDPQADAVLSCNLLSQLGLRFGDEARLARVARAHFEKVRSLSVPSLLWADHARIQRVRSPSGEEVESRSTLGGWRPNDRMVDEWSWAVAPWGEIDAQTSVELKVGLWRWSGGAR